MGTTTEHLGSRRVEDNVKKCHVYLVTNRANGKKYVGITVKSVSTRFNQHIRNAMHGKGAYFHNAIRKYGPEAFSVQQLMVCDSMDEAKEMEKILIQKHQSFCRQGGYNCTLGGEGVVGFQPTKEQRERMSEANTGKTHTIETRKKLSAANKGKTLSVEHRKKISDAARGRTLSVEHRKKMSGTMSGRTQSAEHRKKRSESMKKAWVEGRFDDRTLNAETKRKRSESMKSVWAEGRTTGTRGRIHTAETKRKYLKA